MGNESPHNSSKIKSTLVRAKFRASNEHRNDRLQCSKLSSFSLLGWLLSMKTRGIDIVFFDVSSANQLILIVLTESRM